MEQKILTLAEKWEIDAQAYKDGASVITASPQCEKCRYNIVGNVMKCKKYKIGFRAGGGNERGTAPDLYISQTALKELFPQYRVFRVAFDIVCRCTA